jgi:hypothetical protein
VPERLPLFNSENSVPRTSLYFDSSPAFNSEEDSVREPLPDSLPALSQGC